MENVHCHGCKVTRKHHISLRVSCLMFSLLCFDFILDWSVYSNSPKLDQYTLPIQLYHGIWHKCFVVQTVFSTRVLLIWQDSHGRFVDPNPFRRQLWHVSWWRHLNLFNVACLFVWADTPWKFNSSPLKIYLPNWKVIFQPPFFRGENVIHFIPYLGRRYGATLARENLMAFSKYFGMERGHPSFNDQ